MKKLYLFMTALFVAIAANAADWYLIGDISNWETNVANYGMTPTSNANEYTITVDNLNGKFKFCPLTSENKADWANQISNGQDSGNTDVTIGTYTGVKANKDGGFNASSLENVTITLNTSTCKFTISGDTPGSNAKYYAAIKCASYGNTWPEKDNEMTEDNGSYSYIFTNKENFNLRIKVVDGSNETYYGLNNASGSPIGTYETTVGGSTCYFGDAQAEAKAYKISFNPTDNKVTISEYIEVITYPDMVLVGADINGSEWNTSAEANKATSTDGTYTWTFSKLEAQDFKVALFGQELTQDNSWGTGATINVNGNAQTMYYKGGNCVLAKAVENATVIFDKNASTITVSGNEVEDPVGEYYCYFINSNNWSAPTVWAWVSESDKTSCNTNTTWPGDKMVLRGDKWYWEAPAGKVPGIILISDNGSDTNRFSDKTFVNGATYNPDGSTVVIGPSEPCTVYFNAGADWFNLETMNQGRGAATTGDAGKMQACLIKQDGTLEAAKDMTNMMAAGETELPIFSIDVENPRNYKGIQFQCKGANDLTWTYNSVKSADASDYKEAEWERYIYGPGSKKSESVNDCAAEQSYITFDEYVEIRDHEKETIYVIGGGFNSFEYTTNEAGQQVFDLTKPKTYQNWGYGTDGIATASKDDGVYLFPVTFKDGVEDITFKMSWINAEEFRLKVGAAATGDYDSGRDNRWWATFNLGIVGPTFAPKYINADGTTNVQQALKDEVIKLDDNGINYNVQYFANRARKISRYNQYNWWIKKGTLSLDATAARWVVIDTESLTSALVPFRPAPNLSEVTASEASIYDGDLSGYSEALGNKLEGSATSGAARITQTNTATGTATITVSSGISLFDYDYRVEYHLYDGDNLITKFDGKKDAAKYEIKLNNMVASDGAKISVRCFYYDGVNKTYFRSRTQSAEIKAEADSYDAPVAGATSAKLFLDGNGWNAHVTVPFSIKKFKYKESESVEKELVVYPDYSLDVTGDKCENIRLASKDDWHVKAGIGSANHTAWNEEGEYLASEHNWAELSLKSEDATNNNYEFQFVLEGIAPASTSIDDLETQYLWNLNIKAAYPFLLDTQTAPTVIAYDKDNKVIADTPASVRRKAAGDSESSRYNISMNNKSTKVEVKASKETDLSGVNDVEVAEDGEAELYNLQGIRVVGEPAPGIYLRRNGSKVEKVMIH